jgi:hypothetical protein
MRQAPSMKTQLSQRSPVVVAVAVAVFGVLAMLVVDHGPWSRPMVRTAQVYTTTTEAAHAVGATVTPTMRQLELEPIAPGLSLLNRQTSPHLRALTLRQQKMSFDRPSTDADKRAP